MSVIDHHKNLGWACPNCGACYAPFVQTCGRCCAKTDKQPNPPTTGIPLFDRLNGQRYPLRDVTFRGILLSQMSRTDLLRVCSCLAHDKLVDLDRNLGRISEESINTELELADLYRDLNSNPPTAGRTDP